MRRAFGVAASAHAETCATVNGTILGLSAFGSDSFLSGCTGLRAHTTMTPDATATQASVRERPPGFMTGGTVEAWINGTPILLRVSPARSESAALPRSLNSRRP